MKSEIKVIAARAFVDDRRDSAREPSLEFVRLLEDYGRWCREGLDLPRCKTCLSHVTTEAPCYREPIQHSTLTDDEAMYISGRLNLVRQGWPFGFWLFEQIFIHRWEIDDISKMGLAKAYLRRAGIGNNLARSKGIKLYILQKIALKNLFRGLCTDLSRILADENADYRS